MNGNPSVPHIPLGDEKRDVRENASKRRLKGTLFFTEFGWNRWFRVRNPDARWERAFGRGGAAAYFFNLS